MVYKTRLITAAAIAIVLAAAVFIWKTQISAEKPVDNTANTQKPLVLFNYEDYTVRELLAEFEAETGIPVILKEYKSIDEQLSKLQDNAETYDVIIATDHAIPWIDELKLIKQVDVSKVPNAALVQLSFKNDARTFPYLWGIDCMAVNRKFVHEPVDSWEVLWDKRYQGKIALMDDVREAVGVLLMRSGHSLNSKSPQALSDAERNAVELRKNDVELGDTLDNLEKLISGEKWIVQVSSGDVVYKAPDHSEIEYVLPKEGFMIWMDCFIISTACHNPDAACQFVNFMLEPQNAARSASKFCYNAPVRGVSRFMDAAIKNHPLLNLPAEILAHGEQCINSSETSSEYVRIYSILTSR